MHNGVLHVFFTLHHIGHNLSEEIKQNGIGEACSMYELNEKCMRCFGGYT